MFLLALRSLKYRWAAFAATFIGMFLCSGIVIASGGILETGLRDEAPAERLQATPIVIAGDTVYPLPNNPVATLLERVHIDESLISTIQTVPGVLKALPDVSFPAAVVKDGATVNTGVESSGHGWSSAEMLPYALSSGAAPQSPGDVVLDKRSADAAGVTVGGEVKIAVRGTTETFRVTGIAEPGAAVNQAGLFFSPADVQRLIPDPGKVDNIGVFATPGTDVANLRQQLTTALAGKGTKVLTGDIRGHGEKPKTLEVTDLLIIGVLIGGLSTLAGLMGVASTLSLAFQQRQREMALLRSIGTTPRQLKRMIIGETIFVSLIATALSIFPGVLFGEVLYDRIVDTGLVAEGLAFHQGPIPTIVAALISLITSIGAASIAGRRVTKAKAIEALTDAEIQEYKSGKLRPIFAIVCFVISGSLIYVVQLANGPLKASPAIFSCIFAGIGLALLGPIVAKTTTRILGPLVRRTTGIAGYLASLNAQARVTQVAAVITPIMLVTGIATANLYATTTETAATETYTQELAHNVILQSGESGFAPEVLDEIRKVNGVDGASVFLTSAGFIESPADPWQGRDLGGSQIKGFNADAAAKVYGTSVVEGSFSDLVGDTVALTNTHAKDMGAKLGDTISIRMGDRGKVDLKVVALFTAKESFESIVMPAETLEAHTTLGRARFILVNPAAGADMGRLRADLTTAMSTVPGATIGDRKSLNGAFLHHLGAQALVTLLMIAMLVGYIAIQVINNLSLAITKRRREFGLQRLTGSTKDQVLRMTAIEGAQAGIIGIVLGTLITPLTLVPFSLARTGSPIPSGSPWMYIGVVLFAGLLAMGGTLLPTWLELRKSPLEASVVA
ncbi:FtsX-like permease family protein [Amycolatopsis sp. NPDC059657]|uniref:FtsX-like permease family protein n=1 Tax=Amycolatopsis sp. NPDC059657 TaxID=3346899 RepID=UPI00366C3123